MPRDVLIKDGERYGGKYIATRSFKDKTVVTSGKDAAKVYEAAKKKGVKDPVVFFVPKKGMVNIY
ncbi:MAG: hypothetical protein HZA19_05280 [Nitrospirae bacterium]|nr:hypothetical protein [Nitrospirota bacterium]